MLCAYDYGSWIDARTLHKELKVGKDFTNWIKGRISKFEFIESEDWKLTFAKTGKRKNVKVNDYSLTLDMAKELFMVFSSYIHKFAIDIL